MPCLRPLRAAFAALLLLLLSCFVLLAHAQGQAATITYLHNDLAGSPIAATNSTGAVVWKETYHPYGERLANQAPAANQRQWFHGKPLDTDTGLSYFGARYYDPVLGRFMGVDPVGYQDANVHSFNRYAYGNNNPYRYKDPNGMWAEDIVLAIPGLVLGSQSLTSNISSGNYLGAAIDGLGMLADGVALAVPGVPGGAGLAIAGVRGAKGITADAQFAQKTYGSMFSGAGEFAGRSVDDVAAALRSGAMRSSEVPIDYIIRNGRTIILNTRSSQALDAAGIARSEWNGVNRTGNAAYEGRLTDQLSRNPGGPFDTVRRSGGQ